MKTERNKRVLATGGAGFVGSAVVRRLGAVGYEVFVYDNLSKGHRQAVPADRLIQGDLADSKLLREVLSDHEIEAVMHFAASIAVGESTENPRHYYRNNVVNSLALLEAMLDTQVKQILFSSTAAVYAPLEDDILLEDSPLSAVSPYARTKLTMEQMIEDFSRAYGIGYTILRYFNAAGADADGRYGEDHRPETHLIPIVLKAALGQRDKVNIFGKDYDTADGTCVRDYIHVDDLAEAHIRALEAMAPGQGAIYNVGTGKGYSVLDVIQTAEEVVGREIPTEWVSRRAGDAVRLVAGSGKLRYELGWKPAHESLHSIIETAWKWHRTHPDGYRDKTET